MRPNQPSTPSLSLLYTSFQPRSDENVISDKDDHPYAYNTSDYYSPTSPLSSTSTITSSSPTLPSSPTSPSLSPTLFQHIRPISDKLQPLSSPAYSSSHCQNHGHTSAPSTGREAGTGIILRRSPSTVDTLLRQERLRATVNAVERKGLDLLEPRPVDLDPGGIESRIDIQHPLHNHKFDERVRARDEALGLGDGSRSGPAQPKFVMGGIFEVMEGRG